MIIQEGIDLIYLLSHVVNGIAIEKDRVKEMDLSAIYALSKFQSVEALVFAALEPLLPDRELISDDLFREWQEKRDKSIRNSLLLDAERLQLFQWMDSNEIWYLPLKGILLKDYYPGIGLRQMADNDILFDQKYAADVKEWFVSRDYKVEMYDVETHDVYQKKPIYNFEMHRVLYDQNANPIWDDYYADVKKRLHRKDDERFEYAFSLEDCYLYLLSHMWKHIEMSGIGIRSLMDIYLFLKQEASKMDWDYVNSELKVLEIEDFGKETREVAEKLFSEDFDQHHFNDEELSRVTYYLSSGTYGTIANRFNNIMHSVESENGKSTSIRKGLYIFKRVFPGRQFMMNWCKVHAPFFAKHPFLLPAACIYRCIRNSIIKRKAVRKEISILKNKE